MTHDLKISLLEKPRDKELTTSYQKSDNGTWKIMSIPRHMRDVRCSSLLETL